MLRLRCAGGPCTDFRPSAPRVWHAAHLHASPAQAMHPCTPPAPPRCVLTASHIPRARPSALAPWRLQRAQSTAVAPTPLDAPLAADGHPGLFGYLLIEISTLVTALFGLRAVFAFVFSESGVRGDRDVSGRRVPPCAVCALLRGWWCFFPSFIILPNIYKSCPHSRIPTGPSRGLDNSGSQRRKKAPHTDTPTHDPDTRQYRRLLYS